MAFFPTDWLKNLENYGESVTKTDAPPANLVRGYREGSHPSDFTVNYPSLSQLPPLSGICQQIIQNVPKVSISNGSPCMDSDAIIKATKEIIEDYRNQISETNDPESTDASENVERKTVERKRKAEESDTEDNLSETENEELSNSNVSLEIQEPSKKKIKTSNTSN